MAFDIMAALCPYLRGVLGVPVSTAVPADRPTEFCTIERTGGSYELGKDSPNLAVQVWSDTEHGAYTLALVARDALRDSWQSIDEVCRVELGSIYHFPDPDSRSERYQLDVYMTTRP